MKYAIVLLVCGVGLAGMACGGGEKPALTPENELVDSDAGLEAPATSASPAASAQPATSASAKK